MKRILLLTLALCVGFVGFAQNRANISKELKDKMVVRHYQMPADPTPPMTNYNQVPSGNLKDAKMLGEETEIIETLYDLQSNAALSNRLIAWPDGTVAGVCTRGIDQPAAFAFPDRGTGYNYFDGTTWAPKPSARIETIRTGWPSIAPWGDGEIVVAHRSATAPLVLSKRTNKGAGAWTETTISGPETHHYLWPRMVSTGDNNEYVHMFAITAPSGNGGTPYLGQDGALLYNRSSDGGNTWEIAHQLIDGVGIDDYLKISADDYVLTARGNTIALVSVTWQHDMFMLKSVDNGNTWEKTVIWEHPIPLWDIQTMLIDTLFAPGSSADVAIDASGMCHVVYNVTRVIRDATMEPGYYSYFPYYDGIGYWNENMEAPIPEPEDPPIYVQDPMYWTLSPDYLYEQGWLVGYSQDVNGNGTLDFVEVGAGEFPFANYRALGLSNYPALTISEDGIIAVAYSSVTEGFFTPEERYNFRHTWVTFSEDLGNTWDPYFYDLQAGNIFHIYDECIYGQLAPNSFSSDPYFHFMYMADNLPGVYLDEDEQLEPTTNRMIHNKIPKLLVGITESTETPSFTVSEIYPNPVAASSLITLTLSSKLNVAVDIYNITGQKVLEIPSQSMNAGTRVLNIDASEFRSGVYFYTVTAGSEKITRKMIVE